jgi:hypothetical protein
LGLCLFFVILFLIASVIVLSLIPIYLSRKGNNIILDNTNDGPINTVFATDLSNSNGYSIVNTDSLAQQVNFY